MLDALSDFWKPAKKDETSAPLKPEQLQISSTLGFGFVPQVSLSGRRMEVSAINTYQFGDEYLTSFLLTNDKDPAVSMIVAQSDGEYYLAISRRLSPQERGALFVSSDLDAITGNADTHRLTCKPTSGDLKGWLVESYKRELYNMDGRIYAGDFRKSQPTDSSMSKPFKYALLVSDSNEHAIEIEKYEDRLEIYATVYRRISDIGEVTHPATARPDIKLAEPADVKGQDNKPEAKPLELKELPKPAPAPAAAEPAPAIPEPVAPVQLKEVTPPAPAAAAPVAVKQEAPKTPTNIVPEKKEEKPMDTATQTANGVATATPTPAPAVAVQPTAPQTHTQQEVKAVSKTNVAMESTAIECDLRVANKIIDEAIRNELRLTDVVRRIIELPVAYPESVHIPLNLSEEDYALLAIRYGISSTDRPAIKRKILEEINDFSGGAKKQG